MASSSADTHRDLSSDEQSRSLRRTGAGSLRRRRDKQFEYRNNKAVKAIQQYLENKWGVDVDDFDDDAKVEEFIETQAAADSVIITHHNEVVMELTDRGFQALDPTNDDVETIDELLEYYGMLACRCVEQAAIPQVDGVFDRPNHDSECREFKQNSAGSSCSLLMGKEECQCEHTPTNSQISMDDSCMTYSTTQSSTSLVSSHHEASQRSSSPESVLFASRKRKHTSGTQSGKMRRVTPLYTIIWRTTKIPILYRRIAVDSKYLVCDGPFRVYPIKVCCFNKLQSLNKDLIYIVH